MKDKIHTDDTVAVLAGLFLIWAGGEGSYQSVMVSASTSVAYWAWLTLVVAGGMLIGVAINKISLRIKKDNRSIKNKESKASKKK